MDPQVRGTLPEAENAHTYGVVGSFQSAFRWWFWWRWRIFWWRRCAIARRSKNQGSCSSCSRLPRRSIQRKNYQTCINTEHHLFEMQRQGWERGLRPVLLLLQRPWNQGYHTPDGSDGSAITVGLRRLLRVRRGY